MRALVRHHRRKLLRAPTRRHRGQQDARAEDTYRDRRPAAAKREPRTTDKPGAPPPASPIVPRASPEAERAAARMASAARRLLPVRPRAAPRAESLPPEARPGWLSAPTPSIPAGPASRRAPRSIPHVGPPAGMEIGR